jgi:hypothetical protein
MHQQPFQKVDVFWFTLSWQTSSTALIRTVESCDGSVSFCGCGRREKVVDPFQTHHMSTSEPSMSVRFAMTSAFRVANGS